MDNPPLARIGHQSPGRLRLKIDDQRGDIDYFKTLEAALADKFPSHAVSANPQTGSLLIVGEEIDINIVAKHGTAKSFFTLDQSSESNVPLAESVVDPILSVNKKLRQVSGGSLDMPGLIFISALLFGAYEILRGNFRSPPWYTAFWYAFGIYSKLYFDKKSAEQEDPG